MKNNKDNSLSPFQTIYDKRSNIKMKHMNKKHEDSKRKQHMDEEDEYYDPAIPGLTEE